MPFDSLHSSFPEIGWPAIPHNFGASLLAMLYQLETSQWQPVEELRENQLRQLRRLVAHAVRHVPFHRARLNAFIHDPDRLSWEDWRRIPSLKRTDIQTHGNELLSEAYPQNHGAKHKFITSGSSGAPVTVFGTDITNFFWQAITLRDHLWHRRDIRHMLAAIRFNEKVWTEYPHGLKQPSWGGCFEQIAQTGPSIIMDIRSTIREQAEFLRREQPDYLLTYPSNLAALALHFAEHNCIPERLRGLATLGETLSPEQRALCRKIFGLEIKDMYSSQEVGYMALQCPEHEHYHVQSESVLVEVLNERGEECGPGEIGRIFVTPLHNFAMPLLRYDILDYAEVGEKCQCGRGLPVLKQILGRVRNMLVLPSGEKIWPSLGSKYWLKNTPIRQFQFIQKSLSAIELKIVADQPLTGEEEQKLTGQLQERFRHPFTIAFAYCDEIPRGRGGKFEDFRSEIS